MRAFGEVYADHDPDKGPALRPLERLVEVRSEAIRSMCCAQGRNSGTSIASCWATPGPTPALGCPFTGGDQIRGAEGLYPVSWRSWRMFQPSPCTTGTLGLLRFAATASYPYVITMRRRTTSRRRRLQAMTMGSSRSSLATVQPCSSSWRTIPSRSDNGPDRRADATARPSACHRPTRRAPPDVSQHWSCHKEVCGPAPSRNRLSCIRWTARQVRIVAFLLDTRSSFLTTGPGGRSSTSVVAAQSSSLAMSRSSWLRRRAFGELVDQGEGGVVSGAATVRTRCRAGRGSCGSRRARGGVEW